eukprot:TRINITY_DN1003_c0_g1_i1.p1 TRINITY_DN1003_c0_g1~~TRINITY_DN1003_c0_g1_i1.p1  ORF type:complete len:551 (+),score=159.03 TRINITY_DN1003_c0_g1_i1:86-1738(+)
MVVSPAPPRPGGAPDLSGLSYDELLDLAEAYRLDCSTGFDDEQSARETLQRLQRQGRLCLEAGQTPPRPPEQPWGGSGALPYVWRQSASELQLLCPIPDDVVKGDVNCVITPGTLELRVCSRAVISPAVPLHAPVRPEGSHWYIDEDVALDDCGRYPSRVMPPADGSLAAVPDLAAYVKGKRCLTVDLAKATPPKLAGESCGWWTRLERDPGTDPARAAASAVAVAAAAGAGAAGRAAAEGDAAELRDLARQSTREGVRGALQSAAAERESLAGAGGARQAAAPAGADEDLWSEVSANLQKHEQQKERARAAGRRCRAAAGTLAALFAAALVLLGLHWGYSGLKRCAGRTPAFAPCAGWVGAAGRAGAVRGPLAWAIAAEWRASAWWAGAELAQEVAPGVWAGGLAAAFSGSWIAEHNVSAVVAVSELGDSAHFTPGARYHTIPLRHAKKSNFTGYFGPAADFIDAAVAEGRGVLVHSHSGTGRAPVVAAAYLVRFGRRTADVALAQVEAVVPGSGRAALSPQHQAWAAQLQQFAKVELGRGPPRKGAAP